MSTVFTINGQWNQLEADSIPHCTIEPDYRQICCDFALIGDALCMAPATHMTWWGQTELHYCSYHFGIYLASQGLETFRPVEVVV